MTEELGPYSNFRLTARLILPNRPGMFARVAKVLEDHGANLGAVDLVSASAQAMVRDMTFDVRNEDAGERVLDQLRALPDVQVLWASDRIFILHLGGKIRVQPKVPLTTRNALSMVYTPGVGRIALAIAKDPARAYALTTKNNSVVVVTDGSAVLGLGNLGPEAALPVMEGKAMLFKEFAGIDAWPICLNTQDPEAIIQIVQGIAPGFGGVNLEDISAPRCFDIQRRLQAMLDIPVMHDDQRGTAVVILAALRNALKVVNKRLEEARIVVNGLGAAGLGCVRTLIDAGAGYLIGCDKTGIVLAGPSHDLASLETKVLDGIANAPPQGSLQEALKGADVFIGVSAGNILTVSDLNLMKHDRIVFAMANPDPEIAPDLALPHCRIFATGRSDLPNQINNLLAFPGIFRGALDVQARTINKDMILAAAEAIADLIPEDTLSEEYIIPSVFDKQVVQRVSQAVAQAARQTGVARRRPRIEGAQPDQTLD